MMTKGMKQGGKGRAEEDKSTNIKCIKCGEVVGVVAAGFSVDLRQSPGSKKQVCLCKCGQRMVFSVVED